jgi:excisionase family DNA binding protein
VSDTASDEGRLLTVREVADELRLTQQTVRQWIRDGKLPAMRAGKRKYLIRRSDLRRVIAFAVGTSYQAIGTDALFDGALSSERWDLGEVAARSTDQTLGQMRIADESLQHALASMRLAPPDAGYARRLRRLCGAFEQLAIAYEHAAMDGFTNAPPAEPLRLPIPHEIAPDSGRPGPPTLWRAFDDAVDELDQALTGIGYGEISRAFARLSKTVLALADAVELERTGEPQLGALQLRSTPA